ncbi:MAG: AI-2E family transporter [Candidatus Pacebacteria bacterium]|nr:AI-2E family transporter [Candidatus Paceibacterota bacterium]MDD5721865.1 AI-2E family transporter [Candidatus Paceibacterota bacterium]
MNQKLDISWQSFLRFYIILIGFIAAWYFRQIIFIALLSFILASLFEKPIDYLEAKWKNRWLATSMVYLALLGGLSLMAFWLIPILNQSMLDFINLIPAEINKESLFRLWQEWQLPESSVENWLSLTGISQGHLFEFLNQSVGLLIKVLGGAFTAFSVLLFSFFINTEKQGIEKTISLIFPKIYENYVIELWRKTRGKVCNWFFTQLILSCFVGSLVFISFKILGIPQAELLATLTALFDFIPYIGPIIIGLIATLIGFNQSFFLGITALIIFMVIQAIESFIAPLLRAKTMKLNPLIIIIALLIGGKTAGIAGIIIAIPLAAAIVELLRDIQSGRLASFIPQKQLL